MNPIKLNAIKTRTQILEIDEKKWYQWSCTQYLRQIRLHYDTYGLHGLLSSAVLDQTLHVSSTTIGGSVESNLCLYSLK